ncbi:MAG: TonB-dependent receptor [Burkholderiaceae bacterium]|nr:TonB-dependent receptor [Burkholderiaceae bacterium]
MNATQFARSVLVRAVTAALAPLAAVPAVLAQSSPPAPTQSLDRVIITLTPLPRTELDALQPISLLQGESLRLQEGTSLGETLARQLGVQSSAYGAGAGRPIIRGQDAARVRITESGLGVGDVSSLSPDHRVSADTFNSQQVEVLRGPGTLLYGSGASGGLVNIVSQRIPQQRLSDFGAGLHLRGTTAERERLGALELQGPLGTDAAWRLEGFKQRTSDYELAEPVRDASGEVIASDRLPNSKTDTQSIAGGLGFFGSGFNFGAAVQRYESEYGIPNPGEPVTIDLKRTRTELLGDITRPFAIFKGLRSKFAFTDYKHTEFEPSGEPGAIFTNKAAEGRVELPHNTIAGFNGVVGLQLQGAEVRGVGEGTLPETRQRLGALFLVEEQRFGSVRTEFGARYEGARYRVQEDYEDGTRAPSRTFDLYSASAGAGWEFAPGFDVGATLTYSQRAPSAEELYFVGAHPATFAFEIGEPNLRKERAVNLDVSLRKTAGPVRGKVNVFANRVRDYVYGSFDGSTTDLFDEDGNVEETLSNLFYRQDDVQFRGAEAEVEFGDRRGPQARVWGDTVRAKLTSGVNDGANLPRISPTRFGLDLGWRADIWSAQAAVMRVQRQDRTASFDLRDGVPETETAAYTRVDLSFTVSIPVPIASLKLYGQVRNLTDEQIRVHTSFLKDFAPLAGRSYWLGLRSNL